MSAKQKQDPESSLIVNFKLYLANARALFMIIHKQPAPRSMEIITAAVDSSIIAAVVLDDFRVFGKKRTFIMSARTRESNLEEALEKLLGVTNHMMENCFDFYWWAPATSSTDGGTWCVPEDKSEQDHLPGRAL